MTACLWNGNAPQVAQVNQATVTAVPGAGGGTLTAQIGTASINKSVTYTTVASDTTSSAAFNWAAALSAASQFLPEFNEATWSAANNVLTMTSVNPGTPITITFTGAAGATLTSALVTPNSSPSDVGDSRNWLRGGWFGTPALPIAGDDVVLIQNQTPLLWNLDALSAVGFNSLTRYQMFQGTVGLPERNISGYTEYRPLYFAFSGPGGTPLNVVLGIGVNGNGPSRERYNVGAQQTNFNIIATGSGPDPYTVVLAGTNTANTIKQTGGSVAMALLVGETGGLNTVICDGGALIALGSGITYLGGANNGIVTVNNGTLILYDTPNGVSLDQGSQLVCFTENSTFASVSASTGARITWNCNSTITALVLQNASTFDKSGDVQATTLTNVTMDFNTCRILDPNNTLTFTNPVVGINGILAGPFVTGKGRKVQIL
jgi:hypothetical protein